MSKHQIFVTLHPRSKLVVKLGKHVGAHAELQPLSVTGPGWWQIVVESEPNVFTPDTADFPPDGLWNDGQTVLPGDDAWSVQPILDKLAELDAAHGVAHGANFQWPEG